MDSSTTYDKALDYIYSFVDFSRTHQENLSSEDFDLTRMQEFSRLLGNPQNAYPTIHIAGSKGKGSVGAFCVSMLETAGYKTGFYTSPHLKDFEERMQVNRKPIARDLLVEMVEELKPYVSRVPGLTTFEIMTGLAYLYFQRAGVDLAVIEVGLGGRLDATNVIIPEVSVITSLYLDHITILGDTLEEIAAEKAGIIKPGVPVLSAPQEKVAMDVLNQIAEENESDLFKVGEDYRFAIESRSLEGQVFRIDSPERLAGKDYSIPLLGDYQVINAVTAMAALDILAPRGFPVPQDDLRFGLNDVQWPARFEILRRNPPVIVDSAHNPASVKKLRETIDQYYSNQPLILVFGISRDKQLDDMYSAILPRTSYLITTQADHPRAMDAVELLDCAKEYQTSGESVPNVGQALNRALEVAGEEGIVLIAGSIFAAASARIAWFENQ